MYVVLTSENQDQQVPLRASAALDQAIRDKYNLCNPLKIGRPEHLHTGSIKDIKVLRDYNCPHGSPKFYKIFKRHNLWNQTTTFGGNTKAEMFWSSTLHKKIICVSSMCTEGASCYHLCHYHWKQFYQY